MPTILYFYKHITNYTTKAACLMTKIAVLKYIDIALYSSLYT